MVKVTKLKGILIRKSGYTPVLVKSRQDDRRKRSFMRVFTKVLVGLRETHQDGETKRDGGRTQLTRPEGTKGHENPVRAVAETGPT